MFRERDSRLWQGIFRSEIVLKDRYLRSLWAWQWSPLYMTLTGLMLHEIRLVSERDITSIAREVIIALTKWLLMAGCTLISSEFRCISAGDITDIAPMLLCGNSFELICSCSRLLLLIVFFPEFLGAVGVRFLLILLPMLERFLCFALSLCCALDIWYLMICCRPRLQLRYLSPQYHSQRKVSSNLLYLIRSSRFFKSTYGTPLEMSCLFVKLANADASLPSLVPSSSNLLLNVSHGVIGYGPCLDENQVLSWVYLRVRIANLIRSTTMIDEPDALSLVRASWIAILYSRILLSVDSDSRLLELEIAQHLRPGSRELLSCSSSMGSVHMSLCRELLLRTKPFSLVELSESSQKGTLVLLVFRP